MSDADDAPAQSAGHLATSGEGASEGGIELAASLNDLARLVLEGTELSDILTHIAIFAAEAIPGAEGAGLTLFQDDRPDTVVASAPFVRDVDTLQYRINEGPCILATTRGETVRTGAVADDPRFPGFGPLVSELGVHSMLSLPLLDAGAAFGSINVYARAQNAFDARAQHLGEAFAGPAGISVRNAQLLSQARRLAERLQLALTDQAAAERATGVRLNRAVADREIADAAAIASFARADRAVTAKIELTSRMSHELRTPLNEVLGFAQLLELDPSLTSEQRDAVAHILHGGRNLLEMIDVVLDINSAFDSHGELAFEPVLVGEVLDAAIIRVRPLAIAHQVSVRYDAPLHTVLNRVRADRHQLEQVMMHLLSNAVKFNVEGGNVDLHCTVRAASHLAIAVTDDGPGIAPDDLPRLFVPFDRLTATSTTPGAGLGLPMCAHLVARMRGRLDVTSIRGSGSTFTVTLPISDNSNLPSG